MWRIIPLRSCYETKIFENGILKNNLFELVVHNLFACRDRCVRFFIDSSILYWQNYSFSLNFRANKYNPRLQLHRPFIVDEIFQISWFEEKKKREMTIMASWMNVKYSSRRFNYQRIGGQWGWISIKFFSIVPFFF